MERAILGILMRNRKRNEWIRHKTGMTDVIHRVKSTKWHWGGHIARIEDERWTKRVLDWEPYQHKRPVERPPERWDSDIERFLIREQHTRNQNWQQMVNDRNKWKSLKEAYLQFGE